MLWNRIKGDFTTISDLASYEDKKGIKYIAQSCIIGTFSHTSKLIDKLQQRPNITFVSGTLLNVEYKNPNWFVNYLSDGSSGSRMCNQVIYSDS